MQVQCKADAVGGDMTNANKEITKCLAAMLGISRKQVLLFLLFVSFRVCFPLTCCHPPQTKQVQIMGLMVVVLDVEAVDVFRRLLCSMY